MKKVDRILCCSLLNHESLFDLDYSNLYSLHEPQEFFRILSDCSGSMSPMVCHKDLVFSQRSCDEVIFVLISKGGENTSASDKIALIQFTNRLLKVCKDFLGKLKVENVLNNITLLAEIIDCMLIGGFVHLTETSKIKGFLSQSYAESTSPVSQSLSSSLKPSILSKLSGSGYQPSNQAKVVPVSQSIAGSSKEEIYIDMIETLDFDVNNKGETTCYIRGALNTNNVSNGQKTVHFQLNKMYSKLIGQQSFSSFVDTQKFTTQGLLQVGVPLGQTQLMKYKLTSTDLPFTIVALKGSSAGELIATLHCSVPAAVMCLNVTVTFYLQQKSRGLLQMSKLVNHTLELQDDKRIIVWDVPEIAGQTYSTAHFKVLPEEHGEYHIASPLNVAVKFEISNYLHSGCKLHSVKVDDHKNVKKWIRHLTVAGECKSQILLI